MNEKRIDIMTLFRCNSCVEIDSEILNENGEQYITVQKVESQEHRRLTKTFGNINFTDMWFVMGDIAKDLNGKYAFQNLGLLSQETDHDVQDFWKGCSGKFVTVSMLKIRTDSEKKAPGDFCGQIIEKGRENGVVNYIFRTMDNADLILFSYVGSGGDSNKGTAYQKQQLNKYIKDLSDLSSQFYSIYTLGGSAKICQKQEGSDAEHIIIQECEQIAEHHLIRNKIEENGWCRKKMEDIKKKMEECGNEKNEKYFSYYQAFLHILNVLVQYEQEEKLKDLFFILFPVIRLFFKQLEEAEESLKNQNLINQDKVMEGEQKIEKTMSTFIDSMETLIHHMGHSCPDIISGGFHSGLPFDVPIHLCLMYLAFLSAVTDAMNDEKEYEYQFCLVPVAHSKPTTEIFDFGLQPGSRLIKVQISQRALFMPRPFLAILTHEAAHYVNQSSRMRKERAHTFIKLISHYMVQALTGNLPDISNKENLSGDEREILEEEVECKREKLFELFIKKFKDEVITVEDINGYHFNILVLKFIKICKEVLYDSKNELADILDRADYPYLEALHKAQNPTALADTMFGFIQAIHQNRFQLLGDNQLQEGIESICTILKECYADLACVIFNKLTIGEFLEALVVSESMGKSDEHIRMSPIFINRFALDIMILCEKEKKWEEEWRDIVGLSSHYLKDNPLTKQLIAELVKYISNFQGTDTIAEGMNTEYQVDQTENQEEGSQITEQKIDMTILYMINVIKEEQSYLSKCCEKLVDLQKNSVDIGELLCRLADQFKAYEKNNDKTFDDFFEAYEKIVKKYKEKVQMEWKTEREFDEK